MTSDDAEPTVPNPATAEPTAILPTNGTPSAGPACRFVTLDRTHAADAGCGQRTDPAAGQ